jgi:hypothetical protein
MYSTVAVAWLDVWVPLVAVARLITLALVTSVAVIVYVAVHVMVADIASACGAPQSNGVPNGLPMWSSVTVYCAEAKATSPELVIT